MEATAPFVWPPRPLVSEGAPAAMPVAVAGSVRGVRGWSLAWRSAERAWLSPVREPLERRIEEIGWMPDGPGAYCDRCGHTIGPHERHEFGCGSCIGHRQRWARVVRLGEFRDELRGWVLEAKFEASHAMAVSLGRRLGMGLREAGARVDAVVPVPVDPLRRFLRGIDHTAWIARGVGAELGVPVRRELRARRGPSQRSVAPSAREANVRDRFVRRGGGGGKGLQRGGIVVVDDVMTTGATIRAAVRALAQPGREVWVGVVSVTAEGRLEAFGGVGAADGQEGVG